MQLNKQWSSFLEEDIKSNYFKKLHKFINKEYKKKVIFPNYKDIFKAFELVEPCDVHVVILGQDPYHGMNQANGLAFSVLDNSKLPPSLKNIFIELVDDIGCSMPSNGNLIPWANQGVLLINSVLSVENSKAYSHKNIGWEKFTDNVIKELSSNYKNIVFILWGAYAQRKALFIDEAKNLIIKAPHPSPLSSYRGFFTSKPFSKTNVYLDSVGKKKINWCLT